MLNIPLSYSPVSYELVHTKDDHEFESRLEKYEVRGITCSGFTFVGKGFVPGPGAV